MAINHCNFSQTTLAAAITDTSGTSITVTSETSFPAVNFIISIDTEAMLVTNVATTTWTVTRGYEGSTAATHTNGTAIYHDISAAEADAIAAKLPLAGGTMTGNIVMDNMDVTLVKLLTLHGEIDDGNSSTADVIDWNTGAAHKSTLTGNVTFAFTGFGPTCVPTMSANNAPSGLVIAVGAASITGAGEEGWRAFDTDLTTSYFAPETATYPQGIAYQFVSAKTILAYAFKTGNQTQNMPTAWTFDGSNNGSAWDNLHTLTGQSCSLNTWYYWTPTSTGSYTYYRIQFTAGGEYGARLWEIYLIDTGITNPVNPCFLTLKLVQDGTGGRKITWPNTVKGTPLYDLAANGVTNLLFYWDGTYYWVLNNNGKVVVPASATAKGILGQWAADGSNYYYCSATDTWVRAALATWT